MAVAHAVADEARRAPSSLVAYIVALIKQYAEAPADEVVADLGLKPVRRVPAVQVRREERRGPGVPSKLDSVLAEVVDRIERPNPEVLGALEVSASDPVVVKVVGEKAAAHSLITLLARKGIDAVPGASAQRSRVRVYANGEEEQMLKHLYILCNQRINARIIPVFM